MGFLSTYAPYDEKFADQKTPLGREIVGEEQALIKALEERDFVKASGCIHFPTRTWKDT